MAAPVVEFVSKTADDKVFGLYGAIAAPADFSAAISTHGYKTWLSLVNQPEEVVAAIKAQGAAYHFVPVTVPDTCNVGTAEALHKVLAEAAGPVAIQCATANRASAALAVHYALAHSLPSDKAFAWAAEQSLKCMGTPALRAWIASVTAPALPTHAVGPGKASGIIFRQLFEKVSSTYTYILGDPHLRQALIIDPVLETAQRDIEVVNGLGLSLVGALNTHVHADHVSGTATLKAKIPGLKSMVAKVSQAVCDVPLSEGEKIHFGGRHVEVLSTPGHTDGCLTFVLDDRSMAFTGDALLVRGCGRTDFQQGSAARLWESIHGKIFTLPADCVLYTGHDYNGHSCTTVAEERALNPRLGMGRTQPEFEDIMAKLGLPRPAQIDRAVPANMLDGVVVEPAPAATATA